jgi:hypothetical protein
MNNANFNIYNNNMNNTKYKQEENYLTDEENSVDDENATRINRNNKHKVI